MGVSQWLVMRQWVYKAKWWVITLPICFTLGMLFANFYLVSDVFVMPIHRLTQRIATYFPEIENIQVLGFFAILSALTALIGVGLITGVLLNWLLHFQKKQEVS